MGSIQTLQNSHHKLAYRLFHSRPTGLCREHLLVYLNNNNNNEDVKLAIKMASLALPLYIKMTCRVLITKLDLFLLYLFYFLLSLLNSIDDAATT